MALPQLQEGLGLACNPCLDLWSEVGEAKSQCSQ